MSLLTAGEYRAIANDLFPATTAFIDRGHRSIVSGKTLESVNSATGDVSRHIAACGADNVDLAVVKVRGPLRMAGGHSFIPPTARMR